MRIASCDFGLKNKKKIDWWLVEGGTAAACTTVRCGFSYTGYWLLLPGGWVVGFQFRFPVAFRDVGFNYFPSNYLKSQI